MLNTNPCVAMSWRFKPDRKPQVGTAAKKCLFGATDHFAVRIDLKKQLDSIRQHDMKRWNFDFCKGEPLTNGRYHWESLSHPQSFTDEEKSTVLEVTSRSVDDADRGSSSENDSPDKSPIIGSGCQSGTALSPSAKKDPLSTQKTISDYYPKRKKSPPSIEEDNKRLRKCHFLCERAPTIRSLNCQFQPISKSECS